MLMNPSEDGKTIEIWLENAEKGNEEMNSMIKELCAAVKGTGINIVVYKSGRKNLLETTLELARANL